MKTCWKNSQVWLVSCNPIVSRCILSVGKLTEKGTSISKDSLTCYWLKKISLKKRYKIIVKQIIAAGYSNLCCIYSS